MDACLPDTVRKSERNIYLDMAAIMMVAETAETTSKETSYGKPAQKQAASTQQASDEASGKATHLRRPATKQAAETQQACNEAEAAGVDTARIAMVRQRAS